ncbi:restriction endonuclease subunit S [Pseudomonas aeruginosa]|uniref:restriction endonuclease subunit S n=1 Tax=Pseudomonas aeruginosa TaxID=287 RepID=UPI000FEFB1BB|nr:restriction endonuclease subunit S [Pseudomonas aeruginosa]RPO17565.1 restriction endonuclease [Pseudomonas aeruginosa]
MSWPLVAIKEVAKVVTGKTPSTVDDQNFGGDIPFVTPAELGLDTYVASAPRTLSAKGASEIKLVPKNAVMVCCIGSLGKMAIAGTSVATNQQINSVIFDENRVDAKYGFYALQLLKPKMEAMAPSTTVAIVNKGNFEAMQIPLPPLPEQKRIAAILDKADAIRRKRQQAIQLADDFLRAVYLDMFGDPVTNPKGWDVVELSTLVDPRDKLNYGVVQPGGNEEDGVPLVRSGDLSDVTPDVNQLRRVSASIDSKHRKSKLKGNEILLACVGTIGRVGWVSDAMVGWNIARAVTRIPIREGVNREYVYRYLQSPVVQGYFERETRAVAQPTLNVGLIAKTPVALPPQDLQIAFLERYGTIQAHKERLLNALDAQERLAGSLSQRAFSGKL